MILMSTARLSVASSEGDRCGGGRRALSPKNHRASSRRMTGPLTTYAVYRLMGNGLQNHVRPHGYLPRAYQSPTMGTVFRGQDDARAVALVSLHTLHWQAIRQSQWGSTPHPLVPKGPIASGPRVNPAVKRARWFKAIGGIQCRIEGEH